MQNPATKETEPALEKGPYLPLDIIGLVGEHLVNNNRHGTCAALNVTSDDIHQRTLQALYQVFVCWAAKVHKDFPPLWSRDAREWVEGKTGATRNKREDVRDEWGRIQDFSGARYIEFLDIPFCALDSTQTRAICKHLLGISPSWRTPRLKATISIADDPNVHDDCLKNWNEFRPDLVLNIGSLYRPGSTDFFRLAQALQLFVEDDARRGPGILSRDFRLVVNVCRSSPVPAPVKDLMVNMAEMRCFRNMGSLDICIKTLGGSLPNNTIAGVFLDIAMLMAGVGDAQRRGRPMSNYAPPKRRVNIHVANIGQLVTCARAFRRGAKIYPPLLALSLRFELSNMTTSHSLAVEMDKALCVFRAAYLSVREKFPTSEFGGVTINVPTGRPTACFSWTCHTDGFNGYMHQLVCKFHGHGQTRLLYTDMLAPPPVKPSIEERLEAFKWKDPEHASTSGCLVV